MSTPTNPYLAAQSAWLLRRPLSSTQLVSRTLELLRAHLKLWLALSLVPLLAALLLAAPLLGLFGFLGYQKSHGGTLSPDQIPWGFAVVLFVVAWMGMLVVMAQLLTAITWAALRIDAGADATARQAWQVGWQTLGRATWLLILRTLVASGPLFVGFLVAMALLAASSAAPAGARTGLALGGMLLLFASFTGGMVYSVAAWTWTTLAHPACLMENLPAWSSIQRSLRLTRGARGRIFVAGLLLYLITMAAVVLLEVAILIVVGVGAAIFAAVHPSQLVVAITVGVAILAGFSLLVVLEMLLIALLPIFESIVYRDLRRMEQLRTQSPPPTQGFAGPKFR